MRLRHSLAAVLATGLLTLVAPVVSTAVAAPLTTEQKLEDFAHLVDVIRSSYGPLEYKRARGIDLDQLAATYRERIAATSSNGQFYYLMTRFVADFHDSHFGLSVPTTHVSWLGFTTDLVEGKVVVDEIDRDVLSTTAFPFEKGDELVSVDGRSALDIAHELAPQIGMGNEESQKRLAAMMVSQRSGLRMPVPTGAATVTVKSWRNPSVTRTLGVNWIEKGEALDETESLSLPGTGDLESRPEFPATTVSVAKELGDVLPFGTESSYRCSGKTRIAIPDDATTIMSEPFVAYYHTVGGHKVGYLRLPHYVTYRDGQTTDELLSTYEYAIEKLEANTDGLIIDQDHNCGGSVTVVEELTAMFVDHSFAPLTFQFLASKGEYLDFKSWLDATPQHTTWYDDFKPVVDLVKTTWLAGERLTPKTTFRGSRLVHPRNIRYTKPVIILIDEMSGSGGDAFPSMMQGYGRAKLLGKQTMGAGGHVVEIPFRASHSAFNLRMTKSLFYRPDGAAVENNGASPDIPYEPTLADFTGGYKDFQKFYLAKLLEQLQ